MKPSRLLPFLAAIALAAIALAAPPLAARGDVPPEMRAISPTDVASLASEHRVVTTAPTPSGSLYFRDLGRALSDVLIDLLSRIFGGSGDLWGVFLLWVAYGLLAVFAGVVVFLVGRLLWNRWHEARPTPAPMATVREALAPSLAPRDHEAALRRALDAGRIDEALVALWWWLASSLLQAPADPAWTGRELILRAGRRDLLPWVRRLDRMIYGPVAPDIDALRGFWDELREATFRFST